MFWNGFYTRKRQFSSIYKNHHFFWRLPWAMNNFLLRMLGRNDCDKDTLIPFRQKITYFKVNNKSDDGERWRHGKVLSLLSLFSFHLRACCSKFCCPSEFGNNFWSADHFFYFALFFSGHFQLQHAILSPGKWKEFWAKWIEIYCSNQLRAAAVINHNSCTKMHFERPPIF